MLNTLVTLILKGCRDLVTLERVIECIKVILDNGGTLEGIADYLGISVSDMLDKLLEGNIEVIEPLAPKEISIEDIKAIVVPGCNDEGYRASMRVNDTVNDMFTRFCNCDGRYSKKDMLSKAMYTYMLICSYDEAVRSYSGDINSLGVIVGIMENLGGVDRS